MGLLDDIDIDDIRYAAMEGDEIIIVGGLKSIGKKIGSGIKKGAKAVGRGAKKVAKKTYGAIEHECRTKKEFKKKENYDFCNAYNTWKTCNTEMISPISNDVDGDNLVGCTQAKRDFSSACITARSQEEDDRRICEWSRIGSIGTGGRAAGR